MYLNLIKYTFFHPFIFNLFVSLCFRLISLKQHIIIFSIQYGKLYILTGDFSPFIFVVFIDVFVFVSYRLLCTSSLPGLFCTSFLLLYSSCFLWLLLV